MKNILAILMATAMLVSAVPAFACGGDKSDETTTTSTSDSTKDEHAKACKDPDCACDKGHAKEDKKENAS